jgi:hypothetical protein
MRGQAAAAGCASIRECFFDEDQDEDEDQQPISRALTAKKRKGHGS